MPQLPSMLRLVTIKTAAEILAVSVETLRNWDRSGKLKARRNKNNHYRLYSIVDLELFANKNGLRRRKRQDFRFIR